MHNEPHATLAWSEKERVFAKREHTSIGDTMLITLHSYYTFCEQAYIHGNQCSFQIILILCEWRSFVVGDTHTIL